MKYPLIYARIARMSGHELVRQLKLPQGPDDPNRCSFHRLLSVEAEIRIERASPREKGEKCP